MKQKMVIALGLVVLAIFTFVPSPALAMSGNANYGWFGWGFGHNTAWDQTLTASYRFVVLLNMNSEAVLDRETGLVWEKSPSMDEMEWASAVRYCYGLNLGGRGGFRLPTVEELRSLVDPNKSNPALPAGHPFDNVQVNIYWSSTIYANDTTNAFTVFMSNGMASVGPKSFPHYVWCVRGGH